MMRMDRTRLVRFHRHKPMSKKNVTLFQFDGLSTTSNIHNMLHNLPNRIHPIYSHMRRPMRWHGDCQIYRIAVLQISCHPQPWRTGKRRRSNRINCNIRWFSPKLANFKRLPVRTKSFFFSSLFPNQTVSKADRKIDWNDMLILMN